MGATAHSVMVDNIRCVAISDGTNLYPAAAMFANAPQDRLEQVLREYNLTQSAVEAAYTCMVVETGGNRVLIDTGLGAGAVPTAGTLLSNLQAAGFEPAGIDVVFLTHGHPDHIGANMVEGRPAFPNARYVMSKADWDFWTSSSTLERLAANKFLGIPDLDQFIGMWIRNNLLPIQSRIELIEGEREIVSGVRAIPAPGHTPGHTAVLVSSGSQQLLCAADTVIHPILLQEPDWHPLFDGDPAQAAATRKRLFDRAAADRMQVHIYHFPFPGLGYISAKTRGWGWTPMAGGVPA